MSDLHKSKTKLAPSRQLDALVAEKVMGLTPVNMPPVEIKDEFDKIVVTRIINEKYDRENPPPYSTDISAMRDVIEKLCEMGYVVTVKFLQSEIAFESNVLLIHKETGNKIRVHGDEKNVYSAPHAIALASLKAVGYE